MRRGLLLRQRINESTERDIEARVKIHQDIIARLRQNKRFATTTPQPLVLLAHGDSRFDYPLDGNGLSLSDTDVIAKLRRLGAINPVILNLSHHRDATADEMGWPKQQRMANALADPDNWIGKGPDAILFSGGGNDIAGDRFSIFLNQRETIGGASPVSNGLNTVRFAKALGAVEAGYMDLFAFRDRLAPGVPIFIRCYDFPIPNGSHPDCIGPWLQPSPHFNGWFDVGEGTAILNQALTLFKAMLAGLAAPAAGNNLVLVDTHSTLAADDWANELHPFPDGFAKVADKFVAALRAKFPARI